MNKRDSRRSQSKSRNIKLSKARISDSKNQSKESIFGQGPQKIRRAKNTGCELENPKFLLFFNFFKHKNENVLSFKKHLFESVIKVVN